MTDSIPLPSGQEHTLTKEGAEMAEDGKTYVWTKRYLDQTCSVYEWVEKTTPDFYEEYPIFGY